MNKIQNEEGQDSLMLNDEKPIPETKNKIKYDETSNNKIEGVVHGCPILNVRQGPNTNTPANTTIPLGVSVTINIDESTDTFYKIDTADNITGFCMRQFIKVIQ